MTSVASDRGAEQPDPATVLWRRIPPWHFPKKPQQERPDSSAFDDDGPDEPMSVLVARPGRDPAEVLAGHDGFGLVSLTVGLVTAAGLTVVADPQLGEPDHALVVGPKSLGVRRKMAKAASWVHRPPEAFPPPT